MFPFTKDDGTSEFIVSDDSTVVTTQDFETYTEIIRGLNQNVSLQAVQVREKVWFTNGSDAVFTWDGSTRVTLNGEKDGLTDTPDVPKGKYIDFFQERVFIFNLSDNNSGLNFSALTSTNGIVLAPDDQFAWPIDFELDIARGDGTVGTGLKKYRGQLIIFKEKSIHTLFGISEFDYFARATDSQVGTVSQDSIVLLDNLVYFLGRDGIYAFNGQDSVRISDQIVPDVDRIVKDVSLIVTNVWDTNAELIKGQVFITTITASGLVQMRSEDYFPNNIGTAEPTGEQTYVIDQNNQLKVGFLKSSNTFSSNYKGYVWQFSFWGKCENSPCPIRVDITNARTGVLLRYEFVVPITGVFSHITSTSIFRGVQSEYQASDFGSQVVQESSMSITIGRQNPFTSEVFTFYSATETGQSTILLSPITTGQYMSEVSTISTDITAWGAIDTVDTTNEGVIDLFVRTSTSSVNITTQVWVSIAPGSIINAPIINNYIQWVATITSVSTITPTNIDILTIQHIEGEGSNTSTFGNAWDNRLWLAVSTETTGNVPLIYVKSRVTNNPSNAWMLFDNLKIRSFGEFSNNFYAGASTMPTIYRLDFGTNDKGEPIEGEYDTKELMFGSLFSEKIIHELDIDAGKEAGTNVVIGISKDNGSFTNRTIDLNGTGRLLGTVKDLGGISKGKFYTFRISNSQLDKMLNFHTLGIWNTVTEVKTSKR